MADIRSHSPERWVLGGLALLLLLVLLLSIGSGAVTIRPLEVLHILSGLAGLVPADTIDQGHQIVLADIRAPRVALGMLVGAGLAVSGAAMQGLFRNPLADPALVGISSGAALAAVSVIVLGAGVLSGLQNLLGIYTLPVAAFLGSLATTLFVYRLSHVNGQTDVATLLLAGIAINAVAGAATGLLTYMADDAQLRTLTFWSMGSLGSANWEQVMTAAPFILFAIIVIPLQAKALNAILLGEAEAGHLGFNLERIKKMLIVLVAMAVGTAVTLTGIIGFVGLVVPHLLRLAMGPDHRFLLPASALLGGSLLLAADLLARTIVAPAELPIGIITAALGGPFFLWLLMRFRQRGGLG